MSTTAPRQVVDEAMRLLLAHDMPGFADLWAEDGVLEFPFAAAGSPRRLEGRAAVHDYLRGYNDLVAPRAVTALTLHETTDPTTVVVEFEVEGVAVPTGADYRMAYIAVITVVDGAITHYRDYWSPKAAEDMGFAA
ncbi:nuclear transport factor 2 family protein [Saccharothrix sp. Mg75]|uniref:nuclear transport factor 2 family protein n=1 Tax=Saccharothrix sp. Mg75 TaxID=3445357 RepID=UPI003EEC3BF7